MNLTAKFNASWHPVMKALLLASSLLILLPAANADTVTINSSISGKFLDSGSSNGNFSSPFTAAQFVAAETGTPAFALASTPFYVSSLTDGPGAVWIGTNANAGTTVGDTALYAFSFNISGSVSAASLDLFYAVDNSLGTSPGNPGIYINGTALPSSTSLFPLSTANFTQENLYTDSNIGSLLVTGTNWLFIDAVNLGGPAGLIFSADIKTTSSVVPEPSSLILLGIGFLALLALPAINKRLVQMPSLCG